MKQVRLWLKERLDAGSLLYEVLASLYRRDPTALRRAISIRWHRNGVFDASELAMASGCPRLVIDLLLQHFRPTSALDVGCGTGRTVEYFRACGVDCVGVDGSAPAIAASPVAQHLILADLRVPLNLARQFDLVWSFEVAEHLHPECADTFIDSLVRHGKVVVMSAAPPGQSGVGHVNLQPQEYWIEKLARRGFTHHRGLSRDIHALPEGLSQNFMVFLAEPSGR